MGCLDLMIVSFGAFNKYVLPCKGFQSIAGCDVNGSRKLAWCLRERVTDCQLDGFSRVLLDNRAVAARVGPSVWRTENGL